MKISLLREDESLREAKIILWFNNFGSSLKLSWNWFRGGLCGIGVDADGGDGTVTFGLQIPWFVFLWFTIESRRLIKFLGLDYTSAQHREARIRESGKVARKRVVPACYDMDRKLELRFHDKAIWWKLWWRGNYSSSRDPKWRDGCWHYVDMLLGRHVHRSEKLAERIVEVPLPERTYRAVVTQERDVWKRPRWPWPIVRESYHVDFKKGQDQVPTVPGKGENSWDCGPNGIWSFNVQATSFSGAIVESINRVLKDRVRYGGALNYNERE